MQQLERSKKSEKSSRQQHDDRQLVSVTKNCDTSTYDRILKKTHLFEKSFTFLKKVQDNNMTTDNW